MQHLPTSASSKSLKLLPTSCSAASRRRCASCTTDSSRILSSLPPGITACILPKLPVRCLLHPLTQTCCYSQGHKRGCHGRCCSPACATVRSWHLRQQPWRRHGVLAATGERGNGLARLLSTWSRRSTSPCCVLVCCWPRQCIWAHNSVTAHTGKQVPGDTAVIATFQYQTTAQAIIVIEKVRGDLNLVCGMACSEHHCRFQRVRRMPCFFS